MAAESFRVNVTVPAEYKEKLARLAERTHAREGTLASSLLIRALDEADPEPAHIAELLDRIPGAWERIDRGLEQARRGQTIPLDEL